MILAKSGQTLAHQLTTLNESNNMTTTIKTYSDNALKFRVDGGRVSYPTLNEPRQFQGEGKHRYSIDIVIDSEEAFNQISKIGKAAIVAAVGAAKADKVWAELVAKNKVPFGSGALKASSAGYADAWFITAHTETTPTLLDNVAGEDGKPAALKRPQSRIYSGCHANVVFALYYQSKWQRLCASFSGVQFAGDGEAFGGSAAASADEFEAVEPADMDDLG
jgi:Protein of unknown function (DUF2815)